MSDSMQPENTVENQDKAAGMVVLPGTAAHAHAVFKIAELQKYTPERNHQVGYLISGYSIDTYSRYAEKGFLTVVEKDSTLAGFSVVIPWMDPELESLRDLLKPFLSETALPDVVNTVWLDQIASHPDMARVGAGTSLLHDLRSRHPKHSILSAVTESPVSNIASISWHLKWGFLRIATFSSQEFCGFQNYQSGLYRFSAAACE